MRIVPTQRGGVELRREPNSGAQRTKRVEAVSRCAGRRRGQAPARAGGVGMRRWRCGAAAPEPDRTAATAAAAFGGGGFCTRASGNCGGRGGGDGGACRSALPRPSVAHTRGMSALVHAGSWPAFATPAPDQPLLDNCLECLVQLEQIEFNVYSISKSFPSLCSYQHLESEQLHHCRSVKKSVFVSFSSMTSSST